MPCASLVFPVVMYSCEIWTIKKAEHRRTDAFELWCWRRLLRVPWTARRMNQSILKDSNPEHSLERLMLKLKLQYFGHPMQRTDSFGKTWWWKRLKAAGGGGDRGWDGWMASLTRWTWVWVNCRSWWWTGGLACCSPWGLKESDTTATKLNRTVPLPLAFDNIQWMGIGIESGRIHLDPGTYHQGHLQWDTDISNIPARVWHKGDFYFLCF